MSISKMILNGIPCLSSFVRETDLILYSRDEQFCQIVPNGKMIYAECARLAIENGFQGLPTLQKSEHPTHADIMCAIESICQSVSLQENEDKREMINSIFYILATPMMSQSEKSLRLAKLGGKQHLAHEILNYPTLKQNYRLHNIMLMMTVKDSNILEVDYLLSQSILLRHYGWYKSVAFKAAVAAGHNELAKYLMLDTSSARTLKLVFDNLCIALKSGNIDLVNYFLEIPEVKQYASTNVPVMLEVVSEGGNVMAFDALMAHSDLQVDPSDNNNEALRTACKSGHAPLVKKLLKYQNVINNITCNNNDVFINACSSGNIDIVRNLLKITLVAENINKDNCKSLRMACYYGQLAVVQELTSIPSVMQDVLLWRNDAFERACRSGNVELVKVLLAIPEFRDGLTIEIHCLQLAYQNMRFEVAKYLLTLPSVRKQVIVHKSTILKDIIQSTNIIYSIEENYFDNSSGSLRVKLEQEPQAGMEEFIEDLLLISEIKDTLLAKPEQVFFQACNNSQLGVALAILNYVKDKPEFYCQAMRVACVVNNIQVLQSLLDLQDVKKKAADLNNKAFTLACRAGNVEVVEVLLKLPTVLAAINAIDNDNNGEALSVACQSGNVKLVKRLLAIPAIKAIAADNENLIFKEACAQGQVGVVYELLKIPEIQAQVAGHTNAGLREAVRHGHLDMVNFLLTVPEVKNTFSELGSSLLVMGIESGNIDLVVQLLKQRDILAKINCNQNEALRAAIREGYSMIVEELLHYPQVVASLGENQNTELAGAIDVENNDIINRLLKEPKVCKKVTFKQLIQLLLNPDVELPELMTSEIFIRESLSKSELLDLLYSFSDINPKALAAINQYLSYYGYDPVAPDLSGNELKDALIESIENSFQDYFKDPRTHAAVLLQARAEVAYLFKEDNEYAFLANNAESAMDVTLVSDAVTRFKQSIKPDFVEQFEVLGGVVSIESQIYGALLDLKVTQLSSAPNATSAMMITFIQKNKAALIQREESVMSIVRQHFTSTTDTLDIALRALDSNAPTHGWEKLFVAPSQQKAAMTSFSTRAANATELNLKQASDICREMLCYAFLVSQDPALSELERSELFNVFVFYLAEISRAHNHNSQETDNPSCFPGTLSRLDLIFQRHPKYHIDVSLFNAINEIASELITKALSIELDALPNAEKLSLYEAITLFDHTNALSILHPQKNNIILDTEGNEANLTKLFSLRKDFFEKYFGVKGAIGMQKIREILQGRYNLDLPIEQDIIALLPLLNMSKATPTTTYSLTEAYQMVCPQPQPMQLYNPFMPDYNKIYKLLVMFQEPRRGQYARIKFIDASIKAVYSDLNPGMLSHDLDNHYEMIKSRIVNQHPKLDELNWQLYELVIQELSLQMQCDVARFPTEQQILERIACSTEQISPVMKKDLADAATDPSLELLIKFNQLNLKENESVSIIRSGNSPSRERKML